LSLVDSIFSWVELYKIENMRNLTWDELKM